MAKTNRQKYNFLAALVTQLDGALDEGDDLCEHLREALERLNAYEKRMMEVNDRIDSCNAWIAQLESALEELDDSWSEGSGEEPDEDDDGVDDAELDGVEPPLGGVRPTDGRLAAPVGRTGERPVDRRRVGKTYALIGNGRRGTK